MIVLVVVLLVVDVVSVVIFSQKIYDEFKGYYIDDYVQVWCQFLVGIQVVFFISIDVVVVGFGCLGDLCFLFYVVLVQMLDE